MANKAIFLALIPDSGPIPFKYKLDFEANQIQCEIWDLRYLAQQERQTKLDPISTPYPDVPILQLKANELEQYINENKTSVFITGYRITRHNRFVFQLFKKYNIKYVVFINTNTFFHLQSGKIRRKYIRGGNLSYIVGLTWGKMQQWFNKLAIDIQKPWSSIFGSLNDALVSNYPEPNGGITYFHNHNYEKLIPILTSEKQEQYIVFLDQYLPWHNETQSFDKWNMNAESYYGKIKRLLEKVSGQTGKVPIIATHPKAQKGKIEPFVGNIQVVYGETPQTILKSKICLLHSSTSLDQAILLQKEIVFVTCDEILNSPIEIGTQLMAQEFKKPCLVIEEYINNNRAAIEPYSAIDEKRYYRYITNNIKAGGNIKEPYWQYLARAIKKLELHNE